MPDVSETLKPASEQLDNIDLRGSGPRVFTVTKVDVRPRDKQPVSVHLAEFDRPWKPGKNMRRVLAHYWGRESDNWPGKQVELYADERIKFGEETPGGTRISRMSHIDPSLPGAPVLNGKRAAVYKVDPLPDAPTPEPTEAEVAACTDRDQLRAMWDNAGPERREQIKQRVADLDNEPTP